jgi:hypothetical protein
VVSGAERLAAIAAALEEVGIPFLVMGGHAVRYYGVDRNTIDFDLHLSLDEWDQLPVRLGRADLFAGTPLVEGPSWRPTVFRRFQIGRLPDGREEWMEFWRANHLLAPFADLSARCERGEYGGRVLPFLGLSDPIRSKETERATDWQDVGLLEEIRDARNLADAADASGRIRALSELRSRVGFEAAVGRGMMAHPDATRAAWDRTADPITRGYLTPFVVGDPPAVSGSGMIAEVLGGPLRQVAPASARHLALVEAVRRLFKQQAMAVDRADKEAARRLQM